MTRADGSRRHPVFASWRDRAACLGMDTDLFYPPPGARGRYRDWFVAHAKAVCADCPVRAECLAEAQRRPEVYGVWGGLDERERQKQRKRVRA